MKNVILLNNRSLHLYDFEDLKNNYDLRICAVVSRKYYEDLTDKVKKNIDKIYILPEPLDQGDNFSPFQQELLAPIIEENLSEFKNTYIIGADELNTLTAASLREKYHLPGSPLSLIRNYRNKGIQKTKLSNSNIKTPKFFSLSKDHTKNKINIFNKIKEKLDLPFILKPINMFISIGVEKINSYNQFCNYFEEFSYFSDFIAEEFINGQLYHCDFIIQNNNYLFAEVSEYLFNGLSFLNGCNHESLLLTSDNPLRSSIINFCKEANSILGLKTGCGHFEVFVTKEQELIFLEAAARPAGSLVPLVFSKMFKKNYMNSALLVEIQEEVKSFPLNKPEEYYFWIFFPSQGGRITKLRYPLLQSHYEIEWLVSKNDILSPAASLKDKTGFVIVKNHDYSVLRSDFYFIREFHAIEAEDIP